MPSYQISLPLRYRDILRLLVTPKRDRAIKVDVSKDTVWKGTATAYLADQLLDTSPSDIGAGPMQVKITNIVVWFGNHLLGKQGWVHSWAPDKSDSADQTPPSPKAETKPKGT